MSKHCVRRVVTSSIHHREELRFSVLKTLGCLALTLAHARQAFHALHDQGLASAPLWDSETASVPGMISASDFIQARFLPGPCAEAQAVIAVSSKQQ